MCKLDIYIYLPKNITTPALFASFYFPCKSNATVDRGIYYRVPIFFYILHQ
jgi:hypothetical protein